jgi:hypothetical protein
MSSPTRLCSALMAEPTNLVSGGPAIRQRKARGLSRRAASSLSPQSDPAVQYSSAHHVNIQFNLVAPIAGAARASAAWLLVEPLLDRCTAG